MREPLRSYSVIGIPKLNLHGENAMDHGFNQLRKDIARMLGLSTVANVPYALFHEDSGTMVRLPGPNEFELDYKAPDETRDIIGQGEDEEDAFRNAFSLYREVAAALRKTRKNFIIEEQIQHVSH